jgi:hypothetical protein
MQAETLKLQNAKLDRLVFDDEVKSIKKVLDSHTSEIQECQCHNQTIESYIEKYQLIRF